MPLLQSSVSNGPSEIILICWIYSLWEIDFIIINVENWFLKHKETYGKNEWGSNKTTSKL